MKKYEELKKAVEGGKFKTHTSAGKVARMFLDFEETRMVEAELKASLECDGIIDEDTKHLVVDTAIEVLAEKLVADKVFDYSKKIESFDELFGVLKDIANI